MPHRLADAGIGVQDDPLAGVVDEAHGQAHSQLTPSRFGQQTALEPGPDVVELGFGHRPFQPE